MTRLRKNSIQNTMASLSPIESPMISRFPSVLAATAIMAATETMRPPLAHFQIGGVEPGIGPIAFERTPQKRMHALVDLLAQLRDLRFRDAGHAHGLDQFLDAARRDAVDPGFLDDGGERLLHQPARLKNEAGIIRRPGAEFRDLQIERADARAC